MNAMEEFKEDEGVDVQCTGEQSLQWDSIGLTGNSSTDVPQNNKSRSSPDFLGLSRCAACYDQRGRVEVDHESSTSSENSVPEFDWDSDEPDSSSDSGSVSSAGVPGEDWTYGSGTVTGVISQCENGMGSEEQPQSHCVTQQGSSEEMKENMERQENPERIEGKRRAPLFKSLSLPSSLSFSLLPQPSRATSTLQLQMLPSQHKDVTFCTAPDSVSRRPTENEEDKEMEERDGTRQEQVDSQLSSPRATHQQHQYQEQQQRLSLNQQQHCQQYRQQSPLFPHHVANQFFPLPPPPTPMFPLYTLMPPTYQHTSNHLSAGIHASHIHLHALIPPPYCCCYNKHRFLPHTHWTG